MLLFHSPINVISITYFVILLLNITIQECQVLLTMLSKLIYTMSKNNRGLASADEKTRKRVASKGGKASHDERGLEAASKETRKRVASKGGKASSGGGRKRN